MATGQVELAADGWHERTRDGARRVTVGQAVAMGGNRAAAEVLDRTRRALTTSPVRELLTAELHEAERLLAAAAGHELAAVRERVGRVAEIVPDAAPDVLDELAELIDRAAERVEAWGRLREVAA